MSLLQIAEPNQSANPHQHAYALGIDLGTTRSMVAVVRSGKAAVIKATDMNQVKAHTDSAPSTGDAQDAFDAQDADDTLMPSVVYYGNLHLGSEADNAQAHTHAEKDKQTSFTANRPLVGAQALAYFATDPKNTIISAKRFMGRSIEDIKFSHPYQLTTAELKTGGLKASELKTGEVEATPSQVLQKTMPSFVTAQGDISPVQVSADILHTLKQRAQLALPEGSIQGAVITVPAYFDEAQRQATKDAAQLAGLKVLRLLNEPTAAAVAYGLDHVARQDTHSNSADLEPAKTFLIYDLGGGTFDVSILTMHEGVFEVLATGGNSALGGDDIDRLIMGWLLKQAELSPAEVSPQQKTQIARQAEGYKKALSEHTQVGVAVSLCVSGHQIAWQGVLTRELLSDIIAPIVSRTLATCGQVLRDANIDQQQLNEVILVGGSTRMPLIQQAVANFFDKRPLSHLNPDEVVALGAAQVAEQLIKKDKSGNVLLLDVTPLSLGLETMGGLIEVLIPRNTPIPVAKRQTFTTYQDGQTGMVIHVVQGERDTVAHNRSLGRFELYGIPPMKAGLARIEVTFDIDANGQLAVSAQETTTHVKSEIKITPAYGLSDEQQQQLLRAGFENAEADKTARSLIEAQVEAEREILALQSALQEFRALLSDDEIINLQQAMQPVSQQLADMTALTTMSYEDLISAKAKLDLAQLSLKPLSDAFAARIMNQSVKQSLAGTLTQDWAD